MTVGVTALLGEEVAEDNVSVTVVDTPLEVDASSVEVDVVSDVSETVDELLVCGETGDVFVIDSVDVGDVLLGISDDVTEGAVELSISVEESDDVVVFSEDVVVIVSDDVAD